MIKAICAFVGGLVSYVFPDSATKTLALFALILLTVDTISGVMAAIHEGKRITSSAFKRVLEKFLGYSFVVLVASLCAHAVSMHWKDANAVAIAISAGAALAWIILVEGISILENVRRMGVAVPAFLVRRLTRLRKHLDTDNEPDEPGKEATNDN